MAASTTVRNGHSSTHMLEAVFASKTRDEWEAAFALTDACVTPVLDYVEAASHPANAERSAVVKDGKWLHPADRPAPVEPEPGRQLHAIASRGGDYAAMLGEAGLACCRSRNAGFGRRGRYRLSRLPHRKGPATIG
jgi:crotonobetainyl-CoA:carnitine CoA-transferase CaiB-like acyl-CoA transferase